MDLDDANDTLDHEPPLATAAGSVDTLHDSPHEHDDALDSPHSGNEGDGAPSGQKPSDKSSAPMQKRRRVTRACDECRRKKIKCDGKQPCTHCTVYSYECTYDQPSNRRRNAAPQYTEALELRLKRAEAILRALMPQIDPNDSRIDAALQQGTFQKFATQQRQQQQPAQPAMGPADASYGSGNAAGPGNEPGANGNGGTDGQLDTHLESMVNSTGQLDLDEQGNWDYHGHSSGFSFMERMREQFGNIIVNPQTMLPKPKSRPMSQAFDSPRSIGDSPAVDHGSPGVDLPPRELAKAICENAILDATALLPVLHKPTFFKRFDNIYDKRQEEYGNEEHKFLPLLYAILALGTLFQKETPYENAIDEAFKYFRISRQLIDIADCRNLTSLQAIIYMTFFLQCSAKLSTCYSYIGVALRSALRMGLHRSFRGNFNRIEAEERKRAFWVVRKMDTYVGAILGLPHSLQDEDIDQDMPLEVDDEYITEDTILPMPENEISVNAAGNAHTKLNFILAKIVRVVYPIKGHSNKSSSKDNYIPNTYSVSYSKIREIEKDLQEWMDGLPMTLRPGGEARPIIVRVRHLLRMSYAHTQMMLYRPFLHYIGTLSCKTSKCSDKRAYACAAACISVSRNIVHITAEMKRRGLLIGAYWFTMYTTFFAILSLIYFHLDNPEHQTGRDVLRDAQEGRETLAQVAKRSMAADRCSVVLSSIFAQLPARSSRPLTTQNIDSKKRRPDRSPQPLSGELSTLGRVPSHETDPPQHPRRAATFPEDLAADDLNVATKRASVAFPVGHSSSDSLYSSLFPNMPNLDSFNLDNKPDSSGMLSPAGLTNASTPATLSNLNGNGTPNPGHANFNDTPPNGASSFSGNMHDMSSFHPPITDLSAMMFPSADPFAYPNQPMTTFENAQGLGTDSRSGAKRSKAHTRSFSHQPHSRFVGNNPFVESPGATGTGSRPNSFFSPQPSSSGSNNGTPTSPDLTTPTQATGDLDAQLFGPMPMYMMATNNTTSGGGLGSGNGNENFMASAGPGAFGFGIPGGGFGMGDANTFGGTQGTGGQGGLGFEDLFAGEEWAGFDSGMGQTPSGTGNQDQSQGQGMSGFSFMSR